VTERSSNGDTENGWGGFQALKVEQSGAVLAITLNRPEARNALNMALRHDLERVMDLVRGDRSVRALMITGAGQAFCSGGDIKAMDNLTSLFEARDRVRVLNRVILSLQNLDIPVVAAVNGSAFGAGWSIALACDIIIASENATFCQAFVNVGLSPDCGSSFNLPRYVGMAKAKELVLTGRVVDSAEALRLGLVNRVVPAADLLADATAEAERLAAGPTRGMGAAKALLNGSADWGLAATLEAEANLQMPLRQTADHLEAVQAFREKRRPKFQGA